MVRADAHVAARELITAAGGRLTRPRVETLVALMETGRVGSHADLHRQLPDLDRVSLYRALDWLVEHRLAHQVTDAAGVRRYGFTGGGGDDHRHPHFHCTRCGFTTCLAPSPTEPVRLPKGFRHVDIEVLVKGLCRSCAACA